MVAKILTSSSTFSAVSYNERKNDNGVGGLLVAKNFELNENATKKDYKDYLLAMAKTNHRIKEPQFHATISGKGKESSFEELKDIAEEWIKKMGYGNQPYLVFSHDDTENNHVHIVSVRVDEKGKKISDKFEKIRSQKAICEIMNQDYRKKLADNLKIISDYKISTIGQYKTLLEQAGWNLKENRDSIAISKGGHLINKIDIKNINKQIEKSKNEGIDKKRTKQIAALLYKYKDGMGHSEIGELMKKRFGLSIVYHVSKGEQYPFGYTLIDPSTRSVYKGSDILRVKELITTPERADKIKVCSSLLNDIFSSTPGINYRNLSREMAKYGYTLNDKGRIKLTSEKNNLFALNKEQLKLLKYGDRKEDVNKFSVHSRKEAAILSKLFFVKIDDINVQRGDRSIESNLHYSAMMKSFMNNGKDFDTSVYGSNIFFIENKGEVFLIDKENKEVVSNNELGINIDRNSSSVQILDANKLDNIDVTKNEKFVNGVDLLETIEEFIGQNFGGEQDRKRKKNVERN